MDTSPVDYAYALALTDRINRFVESEPSLRPLVTVGGYNLWQRFQASLFVDAKRWTTTRRVDRATASTTVFLKTVVISAALLGVSTISVVWAALCRKKIWVFTEDHIDGPFKNDFRLGPLYKALSEEKVGFFEVIHTLSGREALKRLIDRRRPVMYLESMYLALWPFSWRGRRRARQTARLLDLSSFDPAERPFVALELEQLLSQAAVAPLGLNVFTALYKISGVRLLFSIDDTRYYQEFVEAGRCLDLPSYAIQHGHFTRYHTGWLKMTNLPGEVMRSGALLVWSEYWKRELLRLGAVYREEEVVVAGEPQRLEPVPREERGLSILVPYELDAPKAAVRSYIDAFLAIGAEVIFKIRADQDKLEQLRAYGLEHLDGRLTVVRNMRDVLPRVSLAVGVYSTLLYDLVALERPVALLETPMDYGEGMIKNGLAGRLRLGPSLEADVRALAATLPEELSARRERLESGRELSRSFRDIIKKHV